MFIVIKSLSVAMDDGNRRNVFSTSPFVYIKNSMHMKWSGMIYDDDDDDDDDMGDTRWRTLYQKLF